jgi:hypothetical protein
VSHFRDELRQIPDLSERARRLLQVEHEVEVELRTMKLRLARDLKAQGKSLAEIGAVFGVTKARAHQMVHERSRPDRAVQKAS